MYPVNLFRGASLNRFMVLTGVSSSTHGQTEAEAEVCTCCRSSSMCTLGTIADEPHGNTDQ